MYVLAVLESHNTLALAREFYDTIQQAGPPLSTVTALWNYSMVRLIDVARGKTK